MSVHQDNLAGAFAAMRCQAQAESDAARARWAALEALVLSLLAALFGRLEALALRHPTRREPPSRQPARRLRHSPYAVPHNTPGPRTARHWGPIPPRAYRLGRLRIWWARNRGARAIPHPTPELRPTHPARAPPRPAPSPISRQNTPRTGCDDSRPLSPARHPLPLPPLRAMLPVPPSRREFRP